jgi:hypothetical protein
MPDAVACLIPITHTEKYEDDPGCVMFEAGEIRQFPRKTAIVPEIRTSEALSHDVLIKANRTNRLADFGQLPPNFEPRFIDAINSNITLSNAEKARWRTFLGIGE